MGSKDEQHPRANNGEIIMAGNGSEQTDEVADTPPSGFWSEFVRFLREHKAWWLIPLIGSLLVVMVLSLMAARDSIPFIYRLF